MAQADYIPAGRTSRIFQGDIEIQIQTEFASRPSPRITTSIFSKGQVMHKVEQELKGQMTSFEDKIRIEDKLRKQHFEVLKTLKDEKKLQSFLSTTAIKEGGGNSVSRRIKDINGVERVFYINNEGEFSSDQISKEFKKKYSVISKSMLEILNIFGLLPNGEREKGVYEVESDRLYLASCGQECYFILTSPSTADVSFESEIRQAILK
jgi:hypothetical protein